VLGEPITSYKIVKDPVHGYLRIYEHEVPLVDNIVFQRLRRIKQLATAELVYPGAVHTRFLHSLGTAHVMEVFVRELLSKVRVSRSDVERYVVLMRLIALLHDIGHGPYSHVFEDAVLYPRNTNHEIMGSRIILEHSEVGSVVERIVESYGYELKDVAKAVAASNIDEWPFRSNIADELNEQALFYLIKGAFSVDIIDYLLRDSYYTGAGYGMGIDWQRIAHYLYPLGSKIALDHRAVEVFDQMILARLWMFSTVYYHKTVRAASKFMEFILRKLDERASFDEYISSVHRYIELDDYSVLLKAMEVGVAEIRDFLARTIPFKAIAEHRLSIRREDAGLETLLALSKSYIEELLEEELRRRGLDLEKEKHFFVDTPRLPLNPVLGDEELMIRLSDGSIVKRRVLELTWFDIPKSIAVVRLYIDRRHVEDVEIVKEAFERIVKHGEAVRSFY